LSVETIESGSAAETEAAGAKLAAGLGAGDVVVCGFVASMT